MKKTCALFLFIFNLCHVATAQHPSGYLGKRLVVSANYGINPFLLSERTTQKSYNSGQLGVYSSKRIGFNVEYVLGEYTAIALEGSRHNNILIIEETSKNQYTPYKMHCTSINPSVRLYKKSMTPAPIGNYVSLGINYTMAKLDSAKILLNSYNLTTSDLYSSDGKYNYFDLSIALGRAYIIKDLVVLRAEVIFPYVFKTFAASFFMYDSVDEYMLKSDPDVLSRTMSRKIAFDNWFNYNISIGIPF